MSTMPVTTERFSNLQLTLLNLYEDDIAEEDLLKIKDLLSRYFFEKAKDEADKAWDAQNLSEEMLLKVHHRTPTFPSPTTTTSMC